MNFTEMVLDPIRTYLDNRRLTVPGGVEGEHGVSWTAEDENALTIVARVPVSYLAANLQENQASVPSFLVCLAYWLEKIRSEPVHCRLELNGDIGSSAGVHVRRSMLLIQEFEAGLHGRFQCVPEVTWEWPDEPVLNRPLSERHGDDDAGPVRSEHDLEVMIAGSAQMLDSFSNTRGKIKRLRRQFPLGLFDGEVSEQRRWTPGQASQVDLWAQSQDGDTVHLFELKKPGNSTVGILSEAFYYARLLHYVRVGLPDDRHITGDWEGVDAVRQADTVSMWLVAPNLHPLVFSRGESPLAWFNEAFNSLGLSFHILPLAGFPDQVHWNWDECWP